MEEHKHQYRSYKDRTPAQSERLVEIFNHTLPVGKKIPYLECDRTPAQKADYDRLYKTIISAAKYAIKHALKKDISTWSHEGFVWSLDHMFLQYFFPLADASSWQYGTMGERLSPHVIFKQKPLCREHAMAYIEHVGKILAEESLGTPGQPPRDA